MAAPFKGTEVRAFPRISENITRDTIYWKHLEPPVTVKEFGAISYVDFCPVQPYHFAVTSSTRVLLYNSRTNQADKVISKFKEAAHCGSFRGDGKLLVAGGDEGVVRLFETGTRSLLRTLRGHQGPVKFAKFTADSLHVVSGSDDKTVKLWDIASESEVTSYSEHADYVKTGAISPACKDIVLSGSYDHTIKLYDTRTPESILTVDHGHPVEDVLVFPGGGVFISAGGDVIKVWDALAGGRLLAEVCHHHKTVTKLSFCSDYQRLMSASLDRHVKIYDVSTYEVVHTLDFPAPILSFGVSPDDRVLAVGMTNGLLSIQHRKTGEEAVFNRKELYNPVLHGKTYQPSKEDIVVEHKRKEQLAKYDRYFKRFEYTKALDTAMSIHVRRKSPEVTVSVIQELIRRDGLKRALAGRDDNSLCHILRFIQKNICNQRFTNTLIDVTNTLMDLYSVDSLEQSSSVYSMLKSIKETVQTDLDFMEQVLGVMGTMESLFAAKQHMA